MNKALFTTFVLLSVGYCAFSQILVPLSTLPVANDELLYQSLLPDSLNQPIDSIVFRKGPGLLWDFSDLEAGLATSELYQAPITGTIADSFPDADLIVDFIGLIGYAKKNTTDISILGISGDSINNIPIPIFGTLNTPFIIRRAPFGFGDQFSTNTSFGITSDASVLDSLPDVQDIINQIPGTTVDSVRITLEINRSEAIDAWGTIMLPSGTNDVLKMTQSDVINTNIEIYAVTFAGSAWVDLSPFLPDDFNELLQVNTTNHLFFGANQKEILAEFSMTSDSTLLSIRYARDISSGIFGSSKFENLINVRLFPNPTRDHIFIEFAEELKSSGSLILIYNLTGEVIYREGAAGATQIALPTLAKGQYFLTINDGAQLLYRAPFIVQ